MPDPPSVGAGSLFDAAHPDYALPKNAATRDAIRDYLLRSHSTYATQHGYGTPAQTLVTRGTSIPSTSVGKRVTSGLARVAWAGKVLPVLSTVLLVADGGELLVKATGAVRNLLFGVDTPPADLPVSYVAFRLQHFQEGAMWHSPVTFPFDGYELQWQLTVGGAWSSTVSAYRQNVGEAVCRTVPTPLPDSGGMTSVSMVEYFRGTKPGTQECTNGASNDDAFLTQVGYIGGMDTIGDVRVRDDDGSTPDQTISAPTRPASSLTDAQLDEAFSDPENDDAREWIDAQIGAPGASDPTVETFTVPDCSGLSVAACITALETAGWTGTETVVELDTAGADLEQPAGAVVDTNPVPGAVVNKDAGVVFSVNPDPLPIVILAPSPGEKYDDYLARLQAAGYVGTATRVDLSETTMDAEAGPDAVTTTEPAPGTRIQPGEAVRIRVNPTTAPAIGGGGSSCEAWVIPALDLSPLLTMLDDAGGVFPFGVVPWLIDSVDGLVAEPVTPSWDFHFPWAGEGDNWTVDLSLLDSVMPSIRTVLLFGSMLGLAWFFFAMATGGGHQRSTGGDS